MKEELICQMAEIEEKHWWFVGRRKIIFSAIKKLLPESPEQLQILDIGCGTGENMKFFSRISKNITGMELNQTALDAAKQKVDFPVYCGKLPDEIPFFDSQFDLIFLLDVLEHIEDEALSLERVKNILKPSGYLVITVPAYKFLWSVHDDLNEHKRRYNIDELRQKAAQSGYDLCFSSYFNSILFAAIAAFRFFKNITKFGEKQSDLFMPDLLINNFFIKLMDIESFLINFLRIPFGCSILLIAKRKNDG